MLFYWYDAVIRGNTHHVHDEEANVGRARRKHAYDDRQHHDTHIPKHRSLELEEQTALGPARPEHTHHR